MKNKKKTLTLEHFEKHLKICCYNLCNEFFDRQFALDGTKNTATHTHSNLQWSNQNRMKSYVFQQQPEPKIPPYFWTRKFSPLFVNFGYEMPVLGCVWIFSVPFFYSLFFWLFHFVCENASRMLEAPKKKRNIKNWFFAAFFYDRGKKFK